MSNVNDLNKMYENDIEIALSASDQQSADIAAAWTEGEMFRLLTGQNSYRVIVVRTEDKRIVADFRAVQDDDGLTITHADAFFGMVGERYTAKTLKEMNFDGGKLVRFNTLTDEIKAIV